MICAQHLIARRINKIQDMFLLSYCKETGKTIAFRLETRCSLNFDQALPILFLLQ